MAEKGKQTHKICTRSQLRNMASEAQREEHVVRVWFRSQRARRKRTDAEGRRFPAPKQSKASKRDAYSPKNSPESPPSVPGTSSSLDPGASLAVDEEHHEEAAAPVLSPVPDAEPKDPLDSIDLEDLGRAPWASITYNLEELIQTYHIPEEDDLDSLDQYLVPSGSDPLGSHSPPPNVIPENGTE